jgi:hypothetical protein
MPISNKTNKHIKKQLFKAVNEIINNIDILELHI